MTSICAGISPQTVRDADTVLGKLGLGFRVQWAIDQIDFDPDVAYSTVEHLVSAAESIQNGSPPDCAALFMGWSGDAASAACDYVECQRSFWEGFADFFLWLAENILQILDYVVDAVRWVTTWLAWLATAASMLVFVIDIIALVVTGGAGSVLLILEAPVFAVLGGIFVVTAVVALLLTFLNMAIEWLESLVRDQRAKFCGKGLPSLPDWDPGGYPPLIPSGDGQ